MVGDLAFVFKKGSLRRVPAKRGEKRKSQSVNADYSFFRFRYFLSA